MKIQAVEGIDAPLVLRPFQTTPADAEAFHQLNVAWISALFTMEPADYKTLLHPEEQVIARGGSIVMAERGRTAVGCCALIAMGPGCFEVSKMAVAESERGHGIGRLLLAAIIAEGRARGAHRLYLETSTRLKNAIHLYEAAGFRHLRAEEVPTSPYMRADVFMELLLSP